MKKEIENIMEVLSKNAWNRREKKIHRLEEQAMNQYDQLVKMFDNAFLTPTPSNFESAHWNKMESNFPVESPYPRTVL